MHQIAPFIDFRGACPRTPLASAWLRDMQISKSEKNHSCPLAKSWLRPWPIYRVYPPSELTNIPVVVM